MSDRSRRRRNAFVAAAAVVAVAAFALRFTVLSREDSVASIRAIQQEKGIPVEVVTAERGDLEVWTTLAGTVEGIVQYPIVSTNTIQVMDVLRREGDRVEAGDVVVRLEKTAPNPMLHSYERSRAVYEDALRDARRMRALYEEGAVSKQRLDKAEMALDIAETDLINARDGIDLAAESEGIVTSIEVERGEMAVSGMPVARIARTDSVRIVFEAGSRQAMAMRKGQKAEWFFSGDGEGGTGEIAVLDLSADPRNHLLGGEAIFPNAGGRLIPGLLVSFRVLTGDKQGVLKIPVGCLIQENGDYSVYVVEERGGERAAALRKVETGLRTSDEVEILSGIEEGDTVVVFGQTLLEDGARVNVLGNGEGGA